MKIYPDRQQRAKWGALEWIAYFGGVIGIASACVTAGAWAWNTLGPAPPPPAEAGATGFVGARLHQAGRPVAVSLVNEGEWTTSYKYSASLQPGPFKLRLPRFHCASSADLAEDAVYIRVLGNAGSDTYPPSIRDRPDFTEVFPYAHGMAAVPHMQTELMFDPGEMAFNVFYGERFSAVTEDRVEISVNSVVDIRDGTDVLPKLERLDLAVGIAGTDCTEMDLLALEFR